MTRSRPKTRVTSSWPDGGLAAEPHIVRRVRMSTGLREKYGVGKYEKCANCMVHSGYEASAVDYTFGSLKGLWATAKATLCQARLMSPMA